MRRAGEAIDPIFGSSRMEGMTPRAVQRGLLQMPNENARHHAMKVLRQMYNEAWNDEQVESNPFLRRIKVSKPKVRRQDVLKPSEFPQWIAAMRGFEHEAAILMVLGGGLRREEAIPLVRDDDVTYVERNGRPYVYLRIHGAVTDFEAKDTKTEDSERTVVIGGTLARRIEELREPGMLVFHGVGGKAIQPNRLSKKYKKWCEQQGVRYVTVKNLRNSYATFRQANGADPTITSKSLGHVNLNIDYDHYFVTQEEAFLRDADLMADAIDGALLNEIEVLEIG